MSHWLQLSLKTVWSRLVRQRFLWRSSGCFQQESTRRPAARHKSDNVWSAVATRCRGPCLKGPICEKPWSQDRTHKGEIRMSPPNTSAVPYGHRSPPQRENAADCEGILLLLSDLPVIAILTLQFITTHISTTTTVVVLLITFSLSNLLTLRRLMSTIVDVPHCWSPKLHFIYLFNKYRYRIF